MDPILSYDLYMDPKDMTLYIFVSNDIQAPFNVVVQTRRVEEGYKIKYIQGTKEN